MIARDGDGDNSEAVIVSFSLTKVTLIATTFYPSQRRCYAARSTFCDEKETSCRPRLLTV
ncbi:hypothetical protein EDWATA_00269 [Edwardsiella tarda ATCC 23685]|uniref:Uncharacterized protein n=1 Tax=Edwardsiella tarda ATCC 23685 TaxID=500638 RepID=D4F0P1_EDWTA|nr:hypothetical protein EDWATA_00269 [Edwardsiella tarda ATCC 23685]